MKKISSIIAAFSLLAATAAAQQLPNSGFENNWQPCTPWSTVETGEIGTEPSPWHISHVYGVNGKGKTTVGGETDGYNNSGKALNLINTEITVVIVKQTIPAYASLGTPWATAKGTKSNKDGGVFGGIEFKYRPDALSFMYKRTLGTQNSNEVAHAIVYGWKGTYTQEDVPGNTVISEYSSVTSTTMIDRDRLILGMETSEGGAKSQTEDAECIFKTIHEIQGNSEDWENCQFEIDYLTSSVPEKMNIIFSATNYFDSENIGKDNCLVVDDVKLIYYSRLNSLKVAGTDVELTEGQYDYTLTLDAMPAASDVEYAVLGQSAKATVAVDEAANKITVTVTNDDADKDGKKEHAYIINVKIPVPAPEVLYLHATTEQGGGWTHGLVEMVKGADGIFTANCDFVAPYQYFFSTRDGYASASAPRRVAGETIDFTNHKVFYNDGNGNVVYKPVGQPLTLAQVQPFTAATNGDGNKTFSVDFNSDEPTVSVEPHGSLTGIETVKAGDDTTAEYYNLQGMRVENPQNGVFIRRQGNNVSKVIL